MTPSGTGPTFEGFGNVVKSIEGLQQRLEDFSIVEVSQAHKSAQTLTTRLAELQKKLAEITRIKQAVAASQSALDNAVLECSSADLTDTADRPLHVPGPTHPSNLLIFPRLNKPAQPTASAPAQAVPTSRFEAVAEAVTPVVAQHDEEPAEPQDHDGRYFIPAAALETEPSGNEPPFSEDIFTDLPEAGPGAQHRESATAPKAPRAADEPDQHAATGGPEFDQRLLDDLIQNYGEFVGSFGPRGPVEESDPVPNTAQVTATTATQASEADRLVKQSGGLTKRNDIDRQLKNIMKDYGPNDIYSPPRAVSMKTGLIGASILVGALLSGYYFFTSSNTPSAPPTRSQSLQSGTSASESSAGGSAAAGGSSKSNGLGAVSKNPGRTD
jgi:hypothetical protein